MDQSLAAQRAEWTAIVSGFWHGEPEMVSSTGRIVSSRQLSASPEVDCATLRAKTPGGWSDPSRRAF
jgi:hypothetical protein